MKNTEYVFTSESVSEGHPDKVCDRISDDILDHYLSIDPNSRVAIETLASTNKVVVSGEVSGPKSVTKEIIEKIIRNAVKDIGYNQKGFHWENITIENYIHEQSGDIILGVEQQGNKDQGAGDQGIMFGYACNETVLLMPAPIFYAQNILKSLADARHDKKISGIGPDSKSQVTLLYNEGKPVKSKAIVVSTQHDASLDQKDVREIVRPFVEKSLPEGWMCEEENFFVNPTGRFVIGGPDGDTGLTGRKIIVDTYGGAAPHGGGAFSGKDPSKVDRSAAYAARYLAKNIVASGLANECTIQLAYAIGIAKPISVNVNCNGKSKIDEDIISQKLQSLIDLSPRGICEHLDLKKPIYSRTSSYGHFGRKPEADGGFSWEKVDLVDKLKTAF